MEQNRKCGVTVRGQINGGMGCWNYIYVAKQYTQIRTINTGNEHYTTLFMYKYIYTVLSMQRCARTA